MRERHTDAMSGRVVVVGSLNQDLVVNLERMPASGETVFGDDPVAMAQAVGAVVHKLETPEKAFQLYNDLKGK